jgi:hypothetical protein
MRRFDSDPRLHRLLIFACVVRVSRYSIFVLVSSRVLRWSCETPRFTSLLHSPRPLQTWRRSSPGEYAVQQSYSARLAAIVLPDVNGQKIQLGSLWKDHPAIVVFLRHYG